MNFRYPLQKIVDLKGSEKSMAEWEYASALGRLKAEEERLEELRLRKEETERQLAEQSLRPTPLNEILRLQQFIEWLDRQVKNQLAEVRKAEDQIVQRRQRLADKMVDEKVWLNAKDKARERFRTEWLAREQNELDEMAVMRAASARA
ncbi:flagellar export protein FliJ [Cohnella thermotolerans]|uniref:flagellar export protein FliJ n=1 Tax=Cohnella thermotolerans TaxID=329858 RepID=UPI0003F56A56|nr:flagellar export protein FliJ [Cohnella thermotolerans]